MTAIMDESVASPASERCFRQEGSAVDEMRSADSACTSEDQGSPNAASAAGNLPGLQSPNGQDCERDKETVYVEQQVRPEDKFEGIIGRSASLRAVFDQVSVVAPTNSTVLILGETGTGKELLARAIHNRSSRRGRNLVRVNCAAIPSGLLESELFGHERGAFTRVLQEQEFERLGSNQTTRVDVRVVAATSCDLPQMVANREFRSDLYYRLNVFPVRLPALRERLEDIPLLVRHFMDLCAKSMNKSVERISYKAMQLLLTHPWPGNVRELQNFIERAVILSPGKVLRPPLSELKAPAADPSPSASDPDAASNATTLKEVERHHILQTLVKTNWVIGGPRGAAARLGLQRTTLLSKMQRLGVSRALA